MKMLKILLRWLKQNCSLKIPVNMTAASVVIGQHVANQSFHQESVEKLDTDYIYYM